MTNEKISFDLAWTEKYEMAENLAKICASKFVSSMKKLCILRENTLYSV